MRKIKSQKKKERVVEEILDSKKKALIVGICAAVILLFTVLIAVENSSEGKLIIENNTSKDLSSVSSYFMNEDAEYQSDDLVDIDLAAGENYKGSLPDLHELAGTASTFIVKFSFDGDTEKTLDSGYFNSNFKGKIKVSFDEDSEGNITIYVKASSGIFGSTLQNHSNDTFDYSEMVY